MNNQNIQYNVVLFLDIFTLETPLCVCFSTKQRAENVFTVSSKSFKIERDITEFFYFVVCIPASFLVCLKMVFILEKVSVTDTGSVSHWQSLCDFTRC